MKAEFAQSPGASGPLVSVIIPTRNRPHLLPKAVASALQWACAEAERTEVIVVPSGTDTSWRESLTPFAGDQRLRVLPPVPGNANDARNAGFAEARGKYVRFLDDDDYLLSGAIGQVERAERDRIEICSGLVLSVDRDGSDLGALPQPESNDFSRAILGFTSLNLPVGNLFLREACTGIRWDPGVERLQDLAWMCSLASTRDLRWARHLEPCGVWFQHDGDRVSSANLARHKSSAAISAIQNLCSAFEAQGKLDDGRKAAIANFLWEFIFPGFPFHPLHWHKIARYASAISPETRPHRLAWTPEWLPALAAEWILLPVRASRVRYRNWRNHARSTHRRTL